MRTRWLIIKVNLLQNVRNRTAERTNGDGLIRCEMNSSIHYFCVCGEDVLTADRIKVEKETKLARAGQGSFFRNREGKLVKELGRHSETILRSIKEEQ